MDPLKPLSSLIRSLAVKRGAREDHKSAATSSAHLPAQPPLTTRLHARLPALTQWDEAQARRVFVECVLLDQLGPELQSDVAFAELVQRASQALGSRPRLTSRLDQVLRDLADRTTA